MRENRFKFYFVEFGIDIEKEFLNSEKVFLGNNYGIFMSVFKSGWLFNWVYKLFFFDVFEVYDF